MMEIRLERNNMLMLRGSVSDTGSVYDGKQAILHFRGLGEQFVQMQVEYKKSLSNDGKVAGSERIALMRRTERMIDIVINLLYIGLCMQNSGRGKPDQQLAIPGQENRLYVLRDGSEWQLRDKRPLYAEETIRSAMNSIANGVLKDLLFQFREDMSDSKLSPDELQALLPRLLDVVVGLAGLRYIIEACVSSV